MIIVIHEICSYITDSQTPIHVLWIFLVNFHFNAYTLQPEKISCKVQVKPFRSFKAKTLFNLNSIKMNFFFFNIFPLSIFTISFNFVEPLWMEGFQEQKQEKIQLSKCKF